MSDSIKNVLVDILEAEAREMSDSYEKAGFEGYGTPQEISDRREEVFRNFLGKYFPYPFRIVKGNIVDSYGERSQSIDCLVINPSHPYTIDSKTQRASVIFADGVDYAIEVKSYLTNVDEISRALQQIRSVKKLRRIRDGILFHNNYSQEYLLNAKTIPCFIVAEETYKNPHTLIERIVDYYISNEIPRIEQFDIILINNKMLIYNIHPNSYIHMNDIRSIAYTDAGSHSLGLFMLEINRMPHSEPQTSKNIMSIYLNDKYEYDLIENRELSRRLIEKGL